jgi:hypothetical protein
MANEQVVCRNCGHVGKRRTTTPGSFLLEIVLWCCFLLPGLLYSAWRIAKRGKTCEACGSGDVVPADTPIGRKLIAENAPGAPAARQAT